LKGKGIKITQSTRVIKTNTLIRIFLCLIFASLFFLTSRTDLPHLGQISARGEQSFPQYGHFIETQSNNDYLLFIINNIGAISLFLIEYDNYIN